MPQFSTFNLVTAVLIGLTIWLAAARFTLKPESNWPLFYYLAVYFYLKKYDNSLEPSFVYVAVVTALLMRFEFLTGWLEKILRTIESLFLLYVIWRGVMLIFNWS